MYSSTNLNNTNIFKERVKDLFNKANIKKLDKEGINYILLVMVYSDKKYITLPLKYKNMIDEYINGLMEGSQT
jgi:RNase P subunit RPR2